MPTGRILRFSEINGYGFIEPDDGGEDVFVHINDVGGHGQVLRPGMRVSYNVLRSDRGLRAYDLEVLAPSRPASTAPVSEPPARPASRPAGVSDDDDVIDVLTATEYEREITEILIDTIATVTAAEIVEVRRRLVKAAASRGWLE